MLARFVKNYVVNVTKPAFLTLVLYDGRLF